MYLNLTNHFFVPFGKINVKNYCKKKPRLPIDKLRPELDFLCDTFCVHYSCGCSALFINTVLLSCVQCVIYVRTGQLICTKCHLCGLGATSMLPMLKIIYVRTTISLSTLQFFRTAQFLYTQFNKCWRYSRCLCNAI